MPEQKPSKGRIVLYTDADGDTAPAIITAVHNATCVNLRVFTDDSEPPAHLTSVGMGSPEEKGFWCWPRLV